MEKITYNNINESDKSTYFGKLIGKQEYKRIRVARQSVAILIKWASDNLGIENILLGVGDSKIQTLRLFQKLNFWRILNGGKNRLLMGLSTSGLKKHND